MSEPADLLDVRGLAVNYGTVEAVRGIDLRVGDGEAVALLGANGAGKSSTLRALSRLQRSAGEIRFADADISRSAPDAVARLGLIHVPEGRRLFGSLSAQENLMVGLTARGNRRSEFEVDDVYDLFPALRPLRRRAGWALSGGEQQMVAIGRGLLAAPRLLLLDEPSLGLAPVVVDAVYRALDEVRSRVSLLVVEQNASLVLKLCGRAYVLAQGRVALSDRSENLADRESLLESYLARDPDASVG